MSGEAGKRHVGECDHCDSGGGVFHGHPGQYLYCIPSSLLLLLNYLNIFSCESDSTTTNVRSLVS